MNQNCVSEIQILQKILNLLAFEKGEEPKKNKKLKYLKINFKINSSIIF